MPLPRWRLALTGGLLIALGMIAVGFVQASTPPVAGPSAENGTDDETLEHRRDRGRGGLGLGRGGFGGGWGRLDQLVHAEAVVDLPEEGLTTFTVDVGTVQSIGEGTITIQPSEGAAVSVATDAETIVRKDREKVGTDGLVVGDRVVVIANDKDGSMVARRILVRPADEEVEAPPEG